jgi:guanyl-specific ribonuclease Sa
MLRLQSLVETPDGIAARLNASMRQATAPLAAKASTAAQEHRRAEEMARTAREAQNALSVLQKAFQELQKHSRQLVELIARGGPDLQELHRSTAAKLESQRAPARGRDGGLSR